MSVDKTMDKAYIFVSEATRNEVSYCRITSQMHNHQEIPW